MQIYDRFKLIPLSAAFLVCAGYAGGSQAGTDEDALNLADAAPLVTERASAWRVSAEASAGRTYQRYGLTDFNQARLSLDVNYDATLRPGWRLVFADRIDRTNRSNDAGNDTVNSLKEAYVSWHPEGNNILDAGRINARYGVAYGYNPTDFFRSGALRSVTSIDRSEQLEGESARHRHVARPDVALRRLAHGNLRTEAGP